MSCLKWRRRSIGVFVHGIRILPSQFGSCLALQFNLFGGTVLKLGTQKHHDLLLRGITTLDDIGCFALTELGYGEMAVTQHGAE
jgi:alkylation response protein AidB-like acyl-CoA dehydrogenase